MSLLPGNREVNKFASTSRVLSGPGAPVDSSSGNRAAVPIGQLHGGTEEMMEVPYGACLIGPVAAVRSQTFPPSLDC